MGKRRKQDTSHAVPHGEGEHGPKTRARLIEQLESAPPEPSTAEMLERDRASAARKGKRRLVEDRQQHDEREKNSERTRLFDEARRGRADGPSDNTGNLHGVLGTREHRADHKERNRKGLPRKGRP
ncbi:MAG TPA: hypothetical protein VJ672_03880 [Gemmatimonadaceae bacterium]|nr:hypothetical protein [Gemmatimonadaceae bacterium]